MLRIIQPVFYLNDIVNRQPLNEEYPKKRLAFEVSVHPIKNQKSPAKSQVRPQRVLEPFDISVLVCFFQHLKFHANRYFPLIPRRTHHAKNGFVFHTLVDTAV